MFCEKLFHKGLQNFLHPLVKKMQFMICSCESSYAFDLGMIDLLLVCLVLESNSSTLIGQNMQIHLE